MESLTAYETPNSLVFVLSAALAPDTGLRSEEPSSVLTTLSRLRSKLESSGYILSKPKLNKTGQAYLTLSFRECKVTIVLGGLVAPKRTLYWLLTLRDKSDIVAGLDGPMFVQVRESIANAVSKEFQLELPIQWLTETEANAVWNRREKEIT